MALFICIDGIDGAGKSTQVRRLAEWMESLGRNAVTTQEPGGTAAGVKIREILVNRNMMLEPDTEMLLFCADRVEHQHKIHALLNEGTDVICDRFLPSTWAYQIFGRKLKPDLLETIIPQTVHIFPDLTVILDMDESVALERSKARLEREGKTFAEGRFEAERIEFFREVRRGFRWYASEGRFGRSILVDASGSEDEVFNNITKEIQGLLK